MPDGLIASLHSTASAETSTAIARSRFIEVNVSSGQKLGRTERIVARRMPSVEFSTPLAECQFVLTEAFRSFLCRVRGQSQDVYSTGRHESCSRSFVYGARAHLGRNGAIGKELLPV
jgi:hypothetical protein